MAEMSSEKRALLDTFGERVQAVRLERKLTQQELADLMNAPRTWVSDLENAGQRGIAAETVVRFAKALGVSTDYLLGMTDDRATTMTTRQRRRKAATKNTPALAMLEQWYATPDATPPEYWDDLEEVIQAHPISFSDEVLDV